MTTPAVQNNRARLLEQLLQERILVIDGAMGTMIQQHKLGEADYRGKRFAEWPSDLTGNNDLLVITQPQIIGGILAEYLEAGRRCRPAAGRNHF